MSPNQKSWHATNDWEISYQRTRRNVNTRARRIKRFKIPRTALILDFGCGDGLDIRAFNKLGYKHVIGVDNSFNLLHNLGNFTSVQSDAYQLAFPADCFDMVFVNSVFHHLHLEPALMSINRVLKPGGRLCFIEPRNSLGRRLLDWLTFSPLAKLWPILWHRRVTLLDEYEEHYHWLSLESNLMKTLYHHGFSDIRTQRDWINMFISCQKPFDNQGCVK